MYCSGILCCHSFTILRILQECNQLKEAEAKEVPAGVAAVDLVAEVLVVADPKDFNPAALTLHFAAQKDNTPHRYIYF